MLLDRLSVCNFQKVLFAIVTFDYSIQLQGDSLQLLWTKCNFWTFYGSFWFPQPLVEKVQDINTMLNGSLCMIWTRIIHGMKQEAFVLQTAEILPKYLETITSYPLILYVNVGITTTSHALTQYMFFDFDYATVSRKWVSNKLLGW